VIAAGALDVDHFVLRMEPGFRCAPVSFFFSAASAAAADFAIVFDLFSLRMSPAGSRFACNGEAHRHIDWPVAPPTEPLP